MVFYPKKKSKVTEEEKDSVEVGDRWTFTNVLPRSSFIHTAHHGKRNQKEADEFIQKIKEHSDGKAPLFLSDGWSSYEELLQKHYSTLIPVPYSGKGRPKKPIRLVDPELLYAQVVKTKQKGKLVSLETRVLIGSEEQIQQRIQQDGRGNLINTSFVESRNTNYRKDNKRLTRKTQCHSKKVKVHDAQIDFITAIYNYVEETEVDRECINPDAKKFEKKYLRKTPAMIEGLIDKKLSMEELLGHFIIPSK